MQKKGSSLIIAALSAVASCNYDCNNTNVDVEYELTTNAIQYPRYFFWNVLHDSTQWVPFRYLPYCGMRLDSIKKILGEPDFVSGCKMVYGLDKYGAQGCDIAPMFANDSCAIVYEYTWQPTEKRVQTVLFFELSHTHTFVDTPLWGGKVDLDKVMLE